MSPTLSLPIDASLPELTAALRQAQSLVVRAPTGAGKTTRVPPALLDAGFGARGRIVMLEPRRLAARAAARRMAQQRGSTLGEEVGYHVRFDRCFGPETRILVVTEGLLVRMLQDDPYLETVGTVIFDEFHERSLDTDLALALVRLLQQTVRPDLKMVIMSATLATQAVAQYLGGCPVVVSEGRLHPVEIRYEPRSLQIPWPVAAAQAVEKMLDLTPGDVLVFLPGLGEILATARRLEDAARLRDLAVVPLYGDLPAQQQDRALLPGTRRKVVLATNVAETSVTVEGVTGVVDTGLARQLVYDPRVGLDRLQLTPISRASAEQRAGRAGRTQPGVCLRLWSEASHRQRAAETEPEIRRLDLAGAVLHLLCMGERDVARFAWLEPPREETVNQALTLLRRLGAVATATENTVTENTVTENTVTELGRTLARLPVHPRLGRLLVEGWRLGQPQRAALAAALLSERDPFTRPMEGARSTAAPEATRSDVLDRIEILEHSPIGAGKGTEHAVRGTEYARFGALNRSAARFVLRARDQLLRLLRQELRAQTICNLPSAMRHCSADDAVLRALLTAFPDRLCRRREKGSRRGLMVGGRGVRLLPVSGVTEPELFLGIDVDAGDTETLVRQASAVERDWLPAESLQSRIVVEFDADAEKVIARHRVLFEDLVLEESTAALPDAEETRRALLEAATANLERVLPPADSAAGLYLIRLRCLRHWMPELQLPAFDQSELRDILPWVAGGCRSFADLRAADWLPAFHGKLTHTQRQAVELEAPERIEAPSGSRLSLRYELGRPPVLAVRIQEIFGWRDTPRVAAGRVPILLHLLAPNHRPQQVTDDLASFWANTYPQIRNALRARYPKHAWPEDPLTAIAERRPRRR